MPAPAPLPGPARRPPRLRRPALVAAVVAAAAPVAACPWRQRDTTVVRLAEGRTVSAPSHWARTLAPAWARPAGLSSRSEVGGDVSTFRRGDARVDWPVLGAWWAAVAGVTAARVARREATPTRLAARRRT